MLQKLTEAEFQQHLTLGSDDEDSDYHYMRMGVCVNQWDNGMGVGLLMLTTLEGTKVTYLHYQ